MFSSAPSEAMDTEVQTDGEETPKPDKSTIVRSQTGEELNKFKSLHIKK